MRRGLAAIGICLLLAAAGTGSEAVAQASVLRVSVGAPASRPVPRDFLGLALEYRAIPVITGAGLKGVNPVLVRLIDNLAPDGRPSLRIGGQSTDRTWWPVSGMGRPLGITYNLTPGWLAAAGSLAKATDARLILGVGLEANRPRIDAVEAGHLVSGIGKRYLGELEIGNEPELYPLIPWYRILRGAPAPWYSKVGATVFSRGRGYGPRAFLSDFSRALAVLPRVPIAGPVTGLVPWIDAFGAFVHRGSRVRLASWHAYGLNQCVTDPSSAQYPSVQNLLSTAASREFVNGIAPYVGVAHRAGAGFRVDEMNSVTCNGRLGVSNTFASALWVMDALFTLADDGVDGVNIHTYPDAANGLFDFNRSHGHWLGTIHPIYYGLLMFAHAAPAGSRVLRIFAPRQSQVRIRATVAPDHRVRVLLINDSIGRAAKVVVRAPGSGAGPAALERLRAPSAYATDRVTLGGVNFGAHSATGSLPTMRPVTVPPRAGADTVLIPASSAALLTLPAKR